MLLLENDLLTVLECPEPKPWEVDFDEENMSENGETESKDRKRGIPAVVEWCSLSVSAGVLCASVEVEGAGLRGDRARNLGKEGVDSERSLGS